MATLRVLHIALHYPMSLDMSIHLHYIQPMKTVTIQIRLQPSEKAAFEQAAESAGISLSSWVRERLRRSAIRDLSEAGMQIAFLQEIKGGTE